MSPSAPSAGITAADAAPATGSLQQALAHARRLLQTAPALAVEQIGEILRVVPEHPAALQLLAEAYSLQGDLPRSVEVLDRLAKTFPDRGEIQFDLGLALLRSGRGRDAIAALRRAVQSNPGLPQAWRLLGDALWAEGERGLAQKRRIIGRPFQNVAPVTCFRHATGSARFLERAKPDALTCVKFV